MTESEALGFINERIDIIKRVFPEITDYMEALEISLKALKKQIPKKPIEMKPTDKLLNGYYACPVCHGWVGMDEYSNKYCGCCGNKIDWSDKD